MMAADKIYGIWLGKRRKDCSPQKKRRGMPQPLFLFFLHLQKFQDLFQRMKSCDPPEYLPPVHDQHSGYLHDLKLFCQLRLFIHIDFTEFHIAGFLCRLFQNRELCFTGATPVCIEVQQHRHTCPCHFSLKIVPGNLFDFQSAHSFLNCTVAVCPKISKIISGCRRGLRKRLPGSWTFRQKSPTHH